MLERRAATIALLSILSDPYRGSWPSEYRCNVDHRSILCRYHFDFISTSFFHIDMSARLCRYCFDIASTLHRRHLLISIGLRGLVLQTFLVVRAPSRPRSFSATPVEDRGLPRIEPIATLISILHRHCVDTISTSPSNVDIESKLISILHRYYVDAISISPSNGDHFLKPYL